MSNVEVLDAPRNTSGGYKVDASRGQRIGRVSSEWFSRPADERYNSLSELFGSVKRRADRSRTRTIESAAVRVDLNGTGALRFHPRCFYRPEDDEASTRDALPALIAAVTGLDGIVSGAHRTWLDPTGTDKAPVATPRRAMGQLLGHGVRFGVVTDVLAAGEGVETMLSLRQILTTLPAVAALSAAHLAALQLQPTLRRLYIARERDDAGQWAADRLATKAREAGIEPLLLDARLGDFNDDLRQLGADALLAHLRVQLAPEDVERFMAPARAGRRIAAA